MTAIAFVGVGAMGSRMARRLADAGHELVVWDRTAERREALGTRTAATPREAAAGAELVVTMVSDPEALRAVSEGPDGIAAGVAPGATVVEMSTVGPPAIRRLASTLPEGVGLLDSPVLGTLPEAESGALRLFVGGPEELLERWRPVLAALGEALYLGPLGSGAAAKLVVNSALLGTVALFGESLALGDALGLPRERVYEALAVSPLGAQVERRRPSIESGEYPPRLRLALARKDLELVRAAAESAGRELPLLDRARQLYAAAEADGLGEADYSVVLARILGA